MADTGRTTRNRVLVYIDDSGATLRNIPVNSISGLGLDYDQHDEDAMYDAIHGALVGTPNFVCTLSGPFDSTADTGSYTVLAPLAGLNVPLAFDVRIGIRSAWDAGEPTFGITGTNANGVLVANFTVNPDDMTYSADIVPYAGTAVLAWATAAHT
jgi:hypothetical protein